MGQIITHPSGRAWARTVANCLCLLTLEGDPDHVSQGVLAMNKQPLFAFYQGHDPAVLLGYLDAAYKAMSTEQREAVFG